MNQNPEYEEKFAELESRILVIEESINSMSDSVLRLDEILYAIAEKILPPEAFESEEQIEEE